MGRGGVARRAVAMQLPREVTVSGGGQLAASLMAA